MTWGAFLSCLVLLAGCRCHRDAPVSGPAPLPKLVEVAGTVTITPEQGARRPALPGPLVRGDLVVTDDSGRALLSLADGRTLEIKGGARFKVGERDGQIVLELQDGILISRSAAPTRDGSAQIELSVMTPFGLVRFPAGATAQVDVRPDGAQIEVSLGEIMITGPDGKVQTAVAGERIALSLGAIEIRRPATPNDATRRTVDVPPFDVVLVAERGALLVRRRDDRRFTVAKESIPIEEGTAFRVPLAAGGRLRAGGFVALLASGTQGRLDDAKRSSDAGERVGLTLDKGSASALFGGGQQLTLGGKSGTVVLRAPGRSTALITQRTSGRRIDVLAGELRVESGGTTETLRAGRSAEIVGGKLHVSARARAALSLPSSRGLRVYGDHLDEVALSWTDEVRDGHIEVATDASFQHLVAAGRVWGTFINVVPPARGDLHWRVLNAEGKVRHRGQARFEPDAGRSVLDLANPHSVVKETGLRATVYFQSVLPSITLSWNPQPKVRKYRVRVYAASNLKAAALERVVEDPSCDLEAGALAEGSYLWGATGLTEDGREFSGGRMNWLDVVYDNPMTTLAIARPKPGQVLHGTDIDAQGVAPLSSKVTINGQPAPLDDKGRFHLSVPRADQLVFRMTDRNGAESYWVRTVKGNR